MRRVISSPHTQWRIIAPRGKKVKPSPAGTSRIMWAEFKAAEKVDDWHMAHAAMMRPLRMESFHVQFQATKLRPLFSGERPLARSLPNFGSPSAPLVGGHPRVHRPTQLLKCWLSTSWNSDRGANWLGYRMGTLCLLNNTADAYKLAAVLSPFKFVWFLLDGRRKHLSKFKYRIVKSTPSTYCLCFSRRV